MKVIDQQTFSSYKKTGVQKLEHILLLLSAIYQIQILSMIGFNLSPLPQRHGTATSKLSLAIGLLPLTLPKVLSPSARTGHSHSYPFPLAWLLELQNNLKLGKFRAINIVFVITMTGEHFTQTLKMPSDSPDLKSYLGTESSLGNTFSNVQFRISSTLLCIFEISKKRCRLDCC